MARTTTLKTEGHQVQCPRCGLLTIAEWAAQANERLGHMSQITQGLSPREQREVRDEPWAEYLQYLKVPTCECPETRRAMAHEYALEHLRPMVARGATIAKLTVYPSCTGHGPFYTAQIGGEVYYNGKKHHIKPRQLVIKIIAGQHCLEIFELTDLFAEMNVALHQMPLRQLSWLEM